MCLHLILSPKTNPIRRVYAWCVCVVHWKARFLLITSPLLQSVGMNNKCQKEFSINQDKVVCCEDDHIVCSLHCLLVLSGDYIHLCPHVVYPIHAPLPHSLNQIKHTTKPVYTEREEVTLTSYT